MELCNQQGFDEEQVLAAVRKQTGKSIDDLTVAELGELVEAADRRLQKIRQAQAA